MNFVNINYLPLNRRDALRYGMKILAIRQTNLRKEDCFSIV